VHAAARRLADDEQARASADQKDGAGIMREMRRASVARFRLPDEGSQHGNL
jgi:hypothetical protein